MLAIEAVTTENQFQAVHGLLAEMARWDAKISEQELGLTPQVVLDFFHSRDPAAFKEQHVAPHGRVLLATASNAPAGCVAYRKLDEHACELQHLWVSNEFRGRGIARSLTERLIADAVAAGYRRMRLETAPFMREAHALYRSLGFQSRGLYREVPEVLQPFTLCMERSLIAT